MNYCHRYPTLSRINAIDSKHVAEAFKFKQSILTAVIASVAQAAVANLAHAADDQSLTLYGITLYGVYDVGLAYQTHGAPLSQDFYPGLEYLISKNSNKSISSIAPNGLSQSKIGLKGTEDLIEGLSFVFNLEMGFQPQSGNLSDALKSLVHNNGVALNQQTSGADGSRVGQFFNGQAYAGLNSKDWGTLTLGRQNTLLLDTINKYDAMGGSYAFSVIGYSGATAGMGNTQDTRLDDSVKYFYKYEKFHAGAMYQFGKSDSSPGEAWQANVGADFGGLSIDGVYGHKKDAIAAASLSATQISILPPNSLAATISDNTSYTLAASYSAGPAKFYAGYEHITYENPSLPISAGFTGLGGYYFSAVNNNAYAHNKVLQVTWLGAKYSFSPSFDLIGAYYHYDQNSYKGNGCSDTSAGSCSGSLNAISVVADYKLTKRFDIYGGVMFSKVADGLASGYLHTSTADPMIGFRFKF